MGTQATDYLIVGEAISPRMGEARPRTVENLKRLARQEAVSALI